MIFSDMQSALNAIHTFMIEHAAKEADDLKADLLTAAASISPVQQIVAVGKAVHEHRAVASEAARELAIAAIQFAAQNAWFGLAASGQQMVEDLKAPPQAKAKRAKSAAATPTTPAVPAAADAQGAP